MPVLFTEEIISTSETQISLQTLIEIIWRQRDTNVVFPTLLKLESFVSIKSDGSKRKFLSRKHIFVQSWTHSPQHALLIVYDGTYP